MTTIQNLAPNAKRSMITTGILAALTVILYLFGVKPTQTSLIKATSEAADVAERHHRMTIDLSGMADTEQQLAEVRKSLVPYHEALLVPLLESPAMRAKSIIDPFAFEAGLRELEYEALSTITLPVPKRALPQQLYVRSPIRIVAQGSYQAAVSFLLRLEKELPFVALQSLAISVQTNPKDQRIEMVLEWPAKGAVTRK